MPIELPLVHQLSLRVTAEQTAEAMGSGLLPVFATPAMVAFMEQTAHTSVGPHLETGQGTVGIDIQVQHLKASLPGTTLTCHSRLFKIEGKRLFFEIEVHDLNGHIIGKATHTRYVIDNGAFLEKLQHEANA